MAFLGPLCSIFGICFINVIIGNHKECHHKVIATQRGKLTQSHLLNLGQKLKNWDKSLLSALISLVAVGGGISYFEMIFLSHKLLATQRQENRYKKTKRAQKFSSKGN